MAAYMLAEVITYTAAIIYTHIFMEKTETERGESLGPPLNQAQNSPQGQSLTHHNKAQAGHTSKGPHGKGTQAAWSWVTGPQAQKEEEGLARPGARRK